MSVFTFRNQITFSGAGVSQYVSRDVTGDGASGFDGTIPHATTNAEVDIAIGTAPKFLFIFSDVALTLKANSSGSPAFTITLAAGVPYVYDAGTGVTSPVTTAVTKFYVTNADATLDASLKIAALQDSTP